MPDCAGRFAQAVSDWDRSHGLLPAIFCGMVGSTIGWKEVPYLKCPADPSAIAAAALRFEVDGRAIAILPGLSCTGKTGAVDVMRGEETQIVGAMAVHPELAAAIAEASSIRVSFLVVLIGAGLLYVVSLSRWKRDAVSPRMG